MDSLNEDRRRSGALLEDFPSGRDVPEMVLRSKKKDFYMKQEEFSERLQLSFGSTAGEFDSKKVTRADTFLVASFTPHYIISLLKALIEKHERKEVYDLNAEFRDALITCPKSNLGVLYAVVRVYDKFVKKWYPTTHIGQPPKMLAKLLIRRANVEHYLRDIFNERAVPRTLKLYIMNTHERNCFENMTKNRSKSEQPLSANTLVRLRFNQEEDDSNSPIAWTQNLNNYRISRHGNLDGRYNYYSCPRLKSLLPKKEPDSRLINPESDVLLAPKPLHYREDSRVQEEIRNAERFNPQFRGNGPRKCNHQCYSAKIKAHKKYSNPKCLHAFHKNSLSSKSSSHRDTFSNNNSEDEQGHPRQQLEVFSELIGHTQIQTWNFANSFDWFTEGRESHSMSSTDAQFSNFDSRILFTRKHSPWICRKVMNNRHKFGDEPAVLNKPSHAEYESIAATVILLKNNLNCVERGTSENFTHIDNSNALTTINSLSPRHLEEELEQSFQERSHFETVIIMENEKNIDRKRREEFQVEKLESSTLEHTFAETIAKNYEEFSQPPTSANERYRTAKKFLSRSTTPLKLKESVPSDLSTINENETMDFEISSPGLTNLTVTRNVSRNDFPVSNIQELSSPKLMLEHTFTKEEKKKLRNRIRMYKQDVRHRTVNDGRPSIHSLYCRYKNTRAKLKLLEALLQKTKDLNDEFDEEKIKIPIVKLRK